MASEALRTLHHTMAQLLAAVCDQLVPAHGPFAHAAAFYFRHGSPGSVAAPFDVDGLAAFVAAFRSKLAQKKLGLAAFLDAGVLELLRLDEAFEVAFGPLEDVPAPDEGTPVAPPAPMTCLVKTRQYRDNATVNTKQIRTLMSIAYRDAAALKFAAHQRIALPAAPNPPRHHATMKIDVVYAADVAMQTVGARATSNAVAIWKCSVTAFATHHVRSDRYPSRANGCGVAVVTVKFEHDESTMLIIFVREVPTLLHHWHQQPEAERQPLRLRHLAPMQVLGFTNPQDGRRCYAVTNVPLTPVVATPAQAPPLPAAAAAPA